MEIKTTRFGTIQIDEHKIISFPKGIPGFENLRGFIILPVEGAKNIQWLQAVEEPAVTLLIIDPFQFFQEYTLNIPDADVQELDIKEITDALVLVTVTIPQGNPAGITANLVAPLVINTRLKKGKQVILTGSPYTTKHLIFPDQKTVSSTKETETISSREGA